MRVAIVNHPHIEQSQELAKRVAALLTEYGADTVCACFDEAETVLSSADVAVALGGDGTMIHVAKLAARSNIPLLGINCGHLGFMAGMESDELSNLKRLVDGQYTVDERQMLEVLVENDEKGEIARFSALNEVAVSRGVMTHVASFTLFDRNKKIASYAADGLLIATPTGSTAYSLSAGGPIVDPRVACFVATPICPNALTDRPIVIGVDAELTMQITPRHEDDRLYLSPDGEQGIEVGRNDRIRVRRHEQTARFIRFTPNAFYDTLHEKMMARTVQVANNEKFEK